MIVNKHEPKECPICGNDVNCTMNSECWCFAIDIPVKVLQYMKENYDVCLCKKCVENLINKIK